MTSYRRKPTIWPEIQFFKKNTWKQPCQGNNIGNISFRENLDDKLLTPGQFLGYPWKLWGITVQTSNVEGRRHQNWVCSRPTKKFTKAKWKFVKNWFLRQSFSHWKFSMWIFFGTGTIETATDSDFRISLWKGGRKFFDSVLPAKLGPCCHDYLATILILEQNPPERIFLYIYLENLLRRILL